MPSQTTIARTLNLSQRTVSLCLSGSDKVADATRERVVAAAKAMGYRPNRSALAMRRGRFNAVALLQGTRIGQSPMPARLLEGLQMALAAHHNYLIVATLSEEPADDAGRLPQVLREWSVDGFLVNIDHHLPPRLLDAIEDDRVPSVWINTKRDHDCVHPDDLSAGRQLTEHLLARGHRRIAFCSHRSFDHHYSVADRHAGYEAAMRDAGLAPRLLYFDDPDWQAADLSVEHLRRTLGGGDRPTAVVAYEALEAHRLLISALRLGLAVPDDLCLATFHALPAHDSGFPIITLLLPEDRVGASAVESLIRRVDGGGRQPPVAVPFTELENGECCLPPRPAGGAGSPNEFHPSL